MQVSAKAEALKPLTSIRFVAAMMIVVLHSNNYFGDHWGWLKHVYSYCGHGVSFFFVLSGFILTHVYRSSGFPEYRTFIVTRFARLWPVHLLSLVVLAVCLPELSVTFDGPAQFSKWWTLAANVALVHALIPNLDYAFSWNAVSWSISTEWFFYLTFPFLLVNIERNWHWKLLGAAIVGASAFPLLHALGMPESSEDVYTSTTDLVLYTNPAVRMFEFCAGMSACVLWNRFARHKTLSVGAWTAIELSVLAFIVALFAGYQTLLQAVPEFVRLWVAVSGAAIPFAGLILVTASARGYVGKALSHRALMFLGEISFSIYMLHQVIMKTCAAYLPLESVTVLELYGAIFAAACISYFAVERPGKAAILWLNRRAAEVSLGRLVDAGRDEYRPVAAGVGVGRSED
jgi:peptidoglycan/LPS O-acetylase OafA/YrhL